jgi:tetratricopeptide (TPR) repeat protein
MKRVLGALAILVVSTSASAQDAPSIPSAPIVEAASGPADAAPDEAPVEAAPATDPSAASLSGGTPAERHAAGVAAYEKGLFAEASAIFLALVRDGHAEPTILLGLGNAAYRRGRFVEAVHAYEWALLLAPADDDVAANLKLARAHLVVDQVATDETAAAAKFREMLRRIPSLWTAIAFVTLWMIGWLVLALRQRGRLVGLAWLAVAAILLSVPPGAHVWYRVRDARGAPRGILQTVEVEVRSGPGESYATLFTLHAGTVVETLEERAGWQRITIPHGPGGWVPSKDLAIFGKPETLRLF